MNPTPVLVPPTIDNVAVLETMLSEPTPGVIETMARLSGDILVLGAAGKMGPSLARMAKRASEEAGIKRRVVAVSRFSGAGAEASFAEHGIETIRADLLDPAQLAALPELPNVVYMAGMKFGSTGQESLTWAMNAYLPGMVCQRFPQSRIVAFSTGNVYPLTPVGRGSVETDTPNPKGDYAMSCLGRERVFEHFSHALGVPVALLRLYYAVEMRYGVLVDLARQVWAEQPIDVTMGYANVIWQGDANAMSLCAFDHVDSPPFVVNLSGPETVSVRRVAEDFGARMKRPVAFIGTESPDALVSNGQLGHRLFGYPRVPLLQMLDWIADWVMRGGASLNKPTHFEVRDGKF